MFNRKKRLEKKKQKYEEKTEELKIKKNFKDQIKSIRFDTFTKAMVALIIIMSCIDLQLSYILAFLDKVQIAEELSKQICITILGVALVYMIRAYFDSKAEHSDKLKRQIHNDIISKSIQNTSESEINTTFDDIIPEDEEQENINEEESILQ